jgi:hypothetical protein
VPKPFPQFGART